MAQILLHGNLHVTIFEASALSTGRASAGAPKFIRKGCGGDEDDNDYIDTELLRRR